MKYPIATIFLLFFLIAHISSSYAQLIHPNAPEYYKMNADRLQIDDIPRVKLKFHNGTIWLKGGLRVSGKLKFVDIDDAIPKVEVKERGSKKKYKIEFPMIKRIAMEGADDFTLRSDSTIFKWIEPLSALLRQVQVGEVELYDNVYIVNEDYTIIPDYIPIVYNYYYDYIIVNDVSDLKDILSSESYVSNMAQVTGRSYSQDPYFINFLVSLYNYPNIVEDLGWSDMQVYLKSGSIEKGIGLAQPTSFTQNKKYPKYAVLHFKDDSDAQILYHSDVLKFVIEGRKFVPIWYRHLNVYTWAEEFRYQEQVYMVTRELKNESHYYFMNGSVEEDLIFLVPESNKDGYKRAHVVPQVRKSYLENSVQ